jgi:hypothetical protein
MQSLALEPVNQEAYWCSFQACAFGSTDTVRMAGSNFSGYQHLHLTSISVVIVGACASIPI